MSNVATTAKNGAVARRPLKVLVPLIKNEIKLGFQAGTRHWEAVGRLLNEARGHWTQAEPRVDGLTFHEWVRENFSHPMSGEPIAERTVLSWMRGAKEVRSRRIGGTSATPNLSDLIDRRSPKHEDYKPTLDWQANVRKVQQSINVEALARQRDDEEAEEREMRALATKIITAGYRALSAVVHPDKPGGSTAAMQKLTKAKKWLEEAIEA